MVQSAMADAEMVGVEPGGAGESRLDLRQAVLAGPGAGADVDDQVRGAVVSWLAGGDAISAALTASGHVDVRRRVLTGETTVLSILGLCLYSGEGYDSVLARVLPAVPGALAPGGKVPTGSALSQARARLPVGPEGEPLRWLFEATAAADGDEVPPGGTAFGLELTAFDGTVADLAASQEIAAEFATPSGGRFPQARLVTLVSCGTRRVRAAALGSSGDSEQWLVDGLRDALGPGMLNLADRNFFSMARWVDFSATGAHLGWRVKNGAKSLPAKVIEVLSDGSSHVRLRESNSMLSRRRAAAGDPELPRLPDTIARLVEFDLLVVDERGRTRRSRFRILTTLLDHRAFSAKQIAALYAQRWQVELVYHRIKVSLRGSGVVLRGHTPRSGPSGDLGFPGGLQRLGGSGCAGGRVVGCRSRRDLFCGCAPPGTRLPHRRLRPLRALRHRRSHAHTDRRDRGASAQPNRPTTHQPPHESAAANRTHPKRHLHDQHRSVESTHSGMIVLN